MGAGKPLGCIHIDVEGRAAPAAVNKIIVGDIKETISALVDRLKIFSFQRT
ncbi:MAG: hypothetical protein QXS79_00355 [Candidatus Bathyarchaeia archaeon]